MSFSGGWVVVFHFTTLDSALSSSPWNSKVLLNKTREFRMLVDRLKRSRITPVMISTPRARWCQCALPGRSGLRGRAVDVERTCDGHPRVLVRATPCVTTAPLLAASSPTVRSIWCDCPSSFARAVLVCGCFFAGVWFCSHLAPPLQQASWPGLTEWPLCQVHPFGLGAWRHPPLPAPSCVLVGPWRRGCLPPGAAPRP